MRVAILVLLIPGLALAATDSPIVIMDSSAQRAERPLTSAYPQDASRNEPFVPPLPKSSAAAESQAPPAQTAKPSANTDTPTNATPASEAIMKSFPGWAISKAGADTTGQQPEPLPADAPKPSVPANPEAPVAAPNATTPVAPASPTDVLWPRDTIPIFMRSCTGLKVELARPCMCVITKLMLAMPHNRFIELSEAGKIDADPIVTEIRNGCLATPERKAE